MTMENVQIIKKASKRINKTTKITIETKFGTDVLFGTNGADHWDERIEGLSFVLYSVFKRFCSSPLYSIKSFWIS